MRYLTANLPSFPMPRAPGAASSRDIHHIALVLGGSLQPALSILFGGRGTSLVAQIEAPRLCSRDMDHREFLATKTQQHTWIQTGIQCTTRLQAFETSLVQARPPFCSLPKVLRSMRAEAAVIQPIRVHLSRHQPAAVAAPLPQQAAIECRQ